MQKHRLEGLSSFVRDLGSECTTLIIHNNALIAGSKDGKIAAWDIDDGREKWTLQVDGPISDIAISDRIYVTASAELHAIEIEQGTLKWTKNIGGSSDLVVLDKDSIWVTSSLYELDVEDYTETTLFQFNKDSKIIKSINFEEKPWFLIMQKNELILGVGRPRCGYLAINSEYEIRHKKIKGQSPITLGIETLSGFLLGHSNGSITEINDDQVNVIQFEKSPITAVISKENNWCVGNSNGTIMSSNGWKKGFVGIIDCLLDVGNFIWASLSNSENNIYLLNRNDGEIQYQIIHDSRIRLMSNTDDKIVVSDQNGKVMLFEEKILSRRLGEIKDFSDDQLKRDLLKKRLRALR